MALVVVHDGTSRQEIERTGATVVDELPHLQMSVVTAAPAAAASLGDLPGVRSVEEDRIIRPALARSVPFIGAAAARVEGSTGQGAWVAVIDTGVHTAHPTFAGAPKLEACFAPSDVVVSARCPNGDTTQVGPGSAAPGSCAECAHGTHVAGIAVGRGGGGAARGVAPGAGLVAIQIFDRPASSEPVASLASLLAGLDHVAGLAATRRIAAVNLSLTFGQPTAGSCDDLSLALRAAVDELRARRVLVVAASGNQGHPDGVGAPACFSRVLSVGSTTLPTGDDPEQVSAFSNTSASHGMVAPGDGIVSALPASTAGAQSGTSMAAPHVSAAAALYVGHRPATSVAQLERLLAETAIDVPDPIRGTQHRVDALALTRSMGDSVGLHDGALAHLRNSLTSGPPARSTPLLVPFDRVVAGDWDGDGVDTLGIRRGAQFLLTDRPDGQGPYTTFSYGWASDTPVVGDWDGNGTDTIGVRRGNAYYLRNTNSSGVAHLTFGYGKGTDRPVVGDWDGNGTDTPGIRRGNAYYLRNSNTSGPAHISFGYGWASDTPIVGDWNGNGTDTPGIRRSTTFHLRNSNTSGPAHISFSYGLAADLPIAGNWDGA